MPDVQHPMLTGMRTSLLASLNGTVCYHSPVSHKQCKPCRVRQGNFGSGVLPLKTQIFGGASLRFAPSKISSIQILGGVATRLLTVA